jgi:chromate transporter
VNEADPDLDSPKQGSVSLRQLALFFLRLGSTAFGGPAAHIAMMEEGLVRRRGWLSREQFLDLLGASNLTWSKFK